VKRRPRVLLLDDDSTIAAGMTALLDLEGIDLHWHSSPITLPIAVNRFSPDLILLDLGMPALSGASLIETTRRILKKRVPTVLFSGRSAQELSRLTEEFDMTGFIAKGDDINHTVANIRFYLNHVEAMKGDDHAATVAASLAA